MEELCRVTRIFGLTEFICLKPKHPEDPEAHIFTNRWPSKGD